MDVHKSSLSLEQQVEVSQGIVPREMWATPSEHDYRVPYRKDSQAMKVRRRNGRGAKSDPLNDQVGEPLNADWVEQLIGYPTGWTNLDSPPDRGLTSTNGKRLVPCRASQRTGYRASRRSATPLCRKSLTPWPAAS